jgi:tRNA(Arg) A34 adenosine deaminase TadA
MHINKINFLRTKAKKLLADKKNKQNLCAFILNKNQRIISIGVNSYKRTSPYQQRIANKINSPEVSYLHAEIHAILKARRKQGKFIFIARLLKSGHLSLARPCAVCAVALKEAGIKFMVYTESETKTVIEKIA